MRADLGGVPAQPFCLMERGVEFRVRIPERGIVLTSGCHVGDEADDTRQPAPVVVNRETSASDPAYRAVRSDNP